MLYTRQVKSPLFTQGSGAHRSSMAQHYLINRHQYQLTHSRYITVVQRRRCRWVQRSRPTSFLPLKTRKLKTAHNHLMPSQ